MLAGKKIIDLSVPLSPDHPCGWPGHPSLQVEGHWFEDHRIPYAHQAIALDEHTGTHFDAPAHFVPPAGSSFYSGPGQHVTSDQIPLDAFIGPARVIDARSAISETRGESGWIDPSYIERDVEQHGALRDGEVVLFRTGWSDSRYLAGNDGSAFVTDPLAGDCGGWPAPSAETIRNLADAGVRAIGVDTPTLGAVQDSFGPHLAALERGLVVVEELTGLGELPAVGALFIFLPLKLVGGTGAPGRAIALIEEKGHG
jgi:kynurenine formamidase